MPNYSRSDISNYSRFIKESIDSLIGMFSHRIKESFLRKMRDKILKDHLEIFGYFDIALSHEAMISGTSDNNVDYELCRNIVSIHRYNSIGLSDAQRGANEKSEDYKDRLAEQAMFQLKTRQYGGYLFRKRPIIPGEDFAFYPPLYLLHVMTVKAEEVLATKRYQGPFPLLYNNFFNKMLSALVLIGDNMLDNAYPLARGTIELYIKLEVLFDVPEAREKHDRFVQYELEKNCHNGQNPDAFLEEYRHRAKQVGGSVDYLHFGWVDDIPDYHDIVRTKPYSIGGLFTYQQQKHGGSTYNLLLILHTRCHAFTHGNMGLAKYPLLHFIDLSMMLILVGSMAYDQLMREIGEDGSILGEPILSRCDKEITRVAEIYGAKSTEMFETFYGYKK